MNPDYLQATEYIDCDHPEIQAFVAEHTAGAACPVDQAVALYHAVRDRITYDPYAFGIDRDAFVASKILARGRGYCVPKAVLLVAAARAMDIPARIGFADVRNHLTTPRLRKLMGTDTFYYHGYVELHLEDRWVKCTPAFNRELCQRFGVRELDFDGHSDSLFHPFDSTGERHMEYLHDHGTRVDMPRDEVVNAYRQHYGPLIAQFSADGAGGGPRSGLGGGVGGDFAAEAATQVTG